MLWQTTGWYFLNLPSGIGWMASLSNVNKLEDSFIFYTEWAKMNLE